MRTFLNILWYFPFFGFIPAIGMAVTGLIFCLTIVGLPIGLGLLQIAKFLLAPFSRTLVDKDYLAQMEEREEEHSVLWRIFSVIVRILYFPVGLVAAITYALAGLFECLTIVGIPTGAVLLKMVGAIFNPVNKVCVPLEDVDEARNRQRQQPVLSPEQQEWMQMTAQVRSASEAELEKITGQPGIYNPMLVQAAMHELEVRANSMNVQPVIDGFTDEQVMGVLRNPGRYSEEMVYCAQKREGEIRRHQIEEAHRRYDEEKRRRRERLDEFKQRALAFAVRWKYAILAGVAVIAGLWVALWLTSDGHRFDNADKDFQRGEWLSAAKTAAKIDNPGSEYFDRAMVLCFNALDSFAYHTDGHPGEEADRLYSDRFDRMTEVVSGDSKLEHVFLAKFNLQKTFYRYGFSQQTIDAARALLRYGYNDTLDDFSEYSAGVTLFLCSEYGQARDALLAVENMPEARSYLGIIILFKLCDNPWTGRDAWNCLRRGVTNGLFGLFAGDAHLVDGSRSTSERLQNARECYSYATLPSNWPTEYLQYRRDIVVNMVSDRIWSDSYSSGSCSYMGQTASYGWDRGANGWGRFKWDDGEVMYGKFRYTGGPIHNVEYLDIPLNLDGQKSIVLYNSPVSSTYFNITSNGSLAYGTARIPFTPLWFLGSTETLLNSPFSHELPAIYEEVMDEL